MHESPSPSSSAPYYGELNAEESTVDLSFFHFSEGLRWELICATSKYLSIWSDIQVSSFLERIINCDSNVLLLYCDHIPSEADVAVVDFGKEISG
jgi:hypothetical protein